ncbi:hypothetical protein [Microbacterium sp. CIAB417]|uniref:hypothetical protein n=1 Tax=Microbacterium sp. CIAB417 TaxID=2860287 RepID=UPI001FADBA63|nr:hypothetical protein [Microbacterium sp. CIAB417]
MNDSAEAATRPPRLRRIALHPLVWAAACTLAALPGYLADGGFFSYLMSVVAGALCGIWFVNLTVRMPQPAGAIAHIVMAIALAPTMFAAIELVPQWLAPGTPRAVYTGALFALPPAAGWVWITLISRITALLSGRTRAQPRVPLTWENDGDAVIVRFRAIPMRMRELTAWIVATILVTGTIVATALIVFGDIVERLGPRLLILALGVLFAFPAYLIVTALLRRRSVDATVRVSRDRVWITAGETTHALRLSQIERLRWGTGSDYARLEVTAPGVDLALLVGMAKQADGLASELPPLPARTLRLAESEGLEKTASRRGLVTLSRA